MPTRDQLIGALRSAHDKGDTEAANRFADMIKQNKFDSQDQANQTAVNQDLVTGMMGKENATNPDYKPGRTQDKQSVLQRARDIVLSGMGGANTLVPSILGAPMDTATAIRNLGTAAYGTGKALLSSPNKNAAGVADAPNLPETAGPQTLGSEWFKNKINQGLGGDAFAPVNPNDPLQRMSASAGQVIGSAMMNPKDVPRTATSLIAPAIGSAAGTELAHDSNNPYLKVAAPLAGMLVGGGVNAAIKTVLNPKTANNPDVQLLQKEGVEITSGQAMGKKSNAIEQKMTSYPVAGEQIAQKRTQSIETFNNAAINRATAPLGVKIQGAGHDAIKQAGDTLSQAYDDVLANTEGIKFSPSAEPYKPIIQQANSLSDAMKRKFMDTVKNEVTRLVDDTGVLTPEKYQQAVSQLKSVSSNYLSSTDATQRELGEVIKNLKTAMDGQLAMQNPKYAPQLSKINLGYANLVKVEQAAVAAKANGGVFTPGQLLNAVKKADSSVRSRAIARGTAQMQDLATAGQNVIGNKIPDSGTAGRNIVAGGTLAGTISGIMHPDTIIPTMAAGSAAVGIPYMAYTQPVQNALVGMMTNRSNALRAASNYFDLSPEARYLAAYQARQQMQ